MEALPALAPDYGLGSQVDTRLINGVINKLLRKVMEVVLGEWPAGCARHLRRTAIGHRARLEPSLSALFARKKPCDALWCIRRQSLVLEQLERVRVPQAQPVGFDQCTLVATVKLNYAACRPPTSR
jgi:hypothetical protein